MILGFVLVFGGALLLAVSKRVPSSLNGAYQGRAGRLFTGLVGVLTFAQGIYYIYEALQKT